MIRRELDSRESLIEGEVEPFKVSRSVDLICLILEEFGVGDGRFHNTRHFFRQKLVLEMTSIERVLSQESSPNSVSTSTNGQSSRDEDLRASSTARRPEDAEDLRAKTKR